MRSASRSGCSATWSATRQRELLAETGLALRARARSAPGWSASRAPCSCARGGRRVDSWCVRVAEPDGLPGGDRVAHLLLALREDELGFATVANLDLLGRPLACAGADAERAAARARRGAGRGARRRELVVVRQQADHVSLGVGEVGDPAVGNFHRIGQLRAAELLRLPQRSLEVVDLDIEGDVAGAAARIGPDPAAQAVLPFGSAIV